MTAPSPDPRDELLKTIGARIATERGQQGRTQAELADAVSVSRHTISLWEHGHRAITIPNLIKLAEALAVSPGWLLGEQHWRCAMKADVAPLVAAGPPPTWTRATCGLAAGHSGFHRDFALEKRW